MKRIHFLVISISITLYGILHAQVHTKQDSLWSLLQKSKADTHKVVNLLQYGEIFEISHPDTALYYYAMAKELSEKLQFKKGLSAVTNYSIYILNNQGKFKEALELCKENLQRWEGSGNKRELAAAYINVGSEWQYLSDLETAAENYIKALQFAESNNDLIHQRIANNNLASVFNSLKQYEKGLEYAQKALKIATELQNDYAIASSLINIATSQTNLKKYDAAMAVFKQVETLGEKMEDDIIKMDGWLGMADIYNATQKWPLAEVLYKKLIEQAKQVDAPEYHLYGCMGLSDLFVKSKQFGTAKSYIQTGISVAQSLGTRLELKDLYLRASELYEATGKADSALVWHKKFVLLNDSLLNDKNTASINLQEIKYETAKKQDQIGELKAEKSLQELRIKQSNIFIYILIGSALSILAIALLSYRNYRHKQQLQQLRITELEQEKQLLATEAVLKGQEEERSRLAKDLHDGLGGMLSGIKFSFSNMKENMVMTPENLLVFQRGIDMLDSSITEMRRVAHNMMPEALIKFGLNAALKDLCTQTNGSGMIKVLYQPYGLENLQVNNAVSVTIYRIVQELLNNIVKHANATQAIVQLTKEENKLMLTVEDDGKGFDMAELKFAKGIGWSNIKNRLDYLKGKADVQSAPGKGTSVNIEIDV